MSVLVHIGYHKTASTWLQRHLFKNPEVGFRSIGKSGIDPAAREIVTARALDFDAEASRARFEPLFQAIRDQGRVPVVSNERLSGHPSSGGYDSKEIADRLAEVFPDGKVLMVIREQRSMILSVYKQYVLAGGPCRFPQFVEAPEDPNVRVPWFDYGFYEYDRLIRYYHSRFGPDSVLVLPYEAFVNEPAGFVAAIGSFVDRPLDDATLESMRFREVLHRTPSALAIGLTRWGNRLARRSQYHPAPVVDSPWVVAQVQRITRGHAIKRVPQSVVGRADGALQRVVDDAVGDRYSRSNRETAELTGLDLAGYGWPV